MPDENITRAEPNGQAETVDENSRAFRFGYLEALRAFGHRLQTEVTRCKRTEVVGLERAHTFGAQMHQTMYETLRDAGQLPKKPDAPKEKGA